jgi:hypothetical protein
MAGRKPIPKETETAVLTRSRRRCCLCFFHDTDLGEKLGQLAHLDHDPSNFAEDNLAFLCLPHHDKYDSTTSQSKGLTIEEVKYARDRLYEKLEQTGPHDPSPAPHLGEGAIKEPEQLPLVEKMIAEKGVIVGRDATVNIYESSAPHAAQPPKPSQEPPRNLPEKKDKFAGRETELAEIHERLSKRSTPGDAKTVRDPVGRDSDVKHLRKLLAKTPIVTVYGLQGIGKSTLITEVLRTGADAPRDRRPLRASPGIAFSEIYRHVLAELGSTEENPEIPSVAIGDHVEFGHLAKLARRRPQATILIERAQLLFDKRGLADPFTKALLSYVARKFEGVSIVLESREKPPTGQLFDVEHREFEVRGLNARAVREYFRRPSADGRSPGWDLDADEAAEVYRRLGGDDRTERAHPFAMFLLRGVADGSGESPWVVLKRHPDRLREKLREALFNELYERTLNDSQRHALRICAMYREDIPHDNIDAINTRTGDSGAFDALEARCLLTQDEKGEWYSLHALMAELASERFDAASGEFFEDHEAIADAWLAKLGRSARVTLPNIRSASEAVYHFLRAERLDRVFELERRLLSRNLLDELREWSRRLHAEKRDRENRRVLELILAIVPNDAPAHRFMGESIETLHGKGHADALSHYRRAWELSPSYPQNLANLGDCLVARRQANEFIKLVENLDRTTADQGVNDHVTAILAKALSATGRTKDGSALRRKHIDAGSRHAAFYNDEARYQSEQGNHDEALRLLDLAQKRACADEYTESIRATVLERKGDKAAASALRNKRIDAGSTNAAFYADEARYQSERGNQDEALRLLDLAHKRVCANEYTESIRATVLEKKGDKAAASALRNQRIDAGSTNAAFYNDEARYQSEQGNPDEALRLLELAQKVGCADEYTESVRATVLLRKHRSTPGLP